MKILPHTSMWLKMTTTLTKQCQKSLSSNLKLSVGIFHKRHKKDIDRNQCTRCQGNGQPKECHDRRADVPISSMLMVVDVEKGK